MAPLCVCEVRSSEYRSNVQMVQTTPFLLLSDIFNAFPSTHTIHPHKISLAPPAVYPSSISLEPWLPSCIASSPSDSGSPDIYCCFMTLQTPSCFTQISGPWIMDPLTEKSSLPSRLTEFSCSLFQPNIPNSCSLLCC